MIVTVAKPAQAGRIDATVAAPGPHDFAVRSFAVVGVPETRDIAASIAFRPDVS